MKKKKTISYWTFFFFFFLSLIMENVFIVLEERIVQVEKKMYRVPVVDVSSPASQLRSLKSRSTETPRVRLSCQRWQESSRRRLLQIRRKRCKKRKARRRRTAAMIVPVSSRPGQTGSETYVMVPDATLGWLRVELVALKSRSRRGFHKFCKSPAFERARKRETAVYHGWSKRGKNSSDEFLADTMSSSVGNSI